jgi:heavy metal sensor kinase
MFPKSIRWRLQLWQAFLLIGVLAGFGVPAYRLHQDKILSQIDQDLTPPLLALASDVRSQPPFGMPHGHPPGEPRGGPGAGPGGGREALGPPPGRSPSNIDSLPPRRSATESRGPRSRPGGISDIREIRLSGTTADFFRPGRTAEYYYVVWGADHSLRTRSTNAPATVPLPIRRPLDAKIRFRDQAPNREAYQTTEMGDCVLVGRSIAADQRALSRYGWQLVAAGAGVLLLGLGGSWLLAARALRPVENIGLAATRISAGNLAERIDVADTDSELGRLATVLNSTFARLAAAFDQQRQFTADASHELRTPIAVLISETQATLARERTAAEYRDTVEACLETAQQMRRLTQSLLALARYDSGQEAIERLPLDLASPASAGLDLIAPLALERGIRIHADLGPAPAVGDADRLSQVMVNLLTNAIEYNRPEGEVRVATRVENGEAVFVVADTGSGISEEDLPHLFKRFYRADQSRSRGSAHYGLGLAISKAIVDAHGGRLNATSRSGVGSEFVLRLPAPTSPCESAAPSGINPTIPALPHEPVDGQEVGGFPLSVER